MDEEMKNEVIQEAPETMPAAEPVAEMPEASDLPAQPDESDSGGISKYFPNVTITEENRAELEDAVLKIEKVDKIMEINRELNMLFSQEPDLARALMDYRDGEDFWVALAKYVDFDSLKPVDGEPDYSKYEENRNMRVKRMQDSETKKSTYEANRKKSEEALMKFQADNNMADEELDSFVEAVDKILDAAFSGEITVDLLNAVYYQMNRDSELASAREVGMVEGKNAKISDLRAKEAEKTNVVVPDLSAGGGTIPKPEKRKAPGADFFDGVL